jgi:hypothetical protein
MPAILIQHPEHGRTHVYNEPELAAHVALGWAVVPEKPAPPPTRDALRSAIMGAADKIAPPPANPPQLGLPVTRGALRRDRPPRSSEGLV